MTPIEQLAAWLRETRTACVFTGAGMSTESGIPDFRSPGGVWSKYQPVYYQEFLADSAARLDYWRQKAEAHEAFHSAKPNRGHRSLARLESLGRVRGVVTQNIDGLHQLAGSARVLELHGTCREIACLDCPARFAADPLVRQFLREERVPDCPDCGGLLKHATISFGQQLSPIVHMEATRWAREADLFLALGSSLVVYPAADLPQQAKRRGARLVIINRDPTPLDPLADLVIAAPLGEALSQAAELCER